LAVTENRGNSNLVLVSLRIDAATYSSVDHLAVHELVRRLEVRDLQSAHSLDGQGDGLIGTGRRVRLSQPLSCRPQGAENLRPIKSLTFTVIAEAHMVVLVSIFYQTDKSLHKRYFRQGAISAIAHCCGRIAMTPTKS
jgi:hypothetical protein